MIARALVIALMLTGVATAQPQSLAPAELQRGPREAEPPYIDLLTFGVGERVFEKFGHAAICVRYHDAARHVPICFNYGVTDFNGGAPMVWRFMRGEQEFWVEPSAFGAMFAFYRGEDRDIWQQTLPVTGAQARAIEQALWASLDGASSRYTYDHFFNNCTTRLRDLLNEATGGKLAVGGDERYPLTFRQLGYRGLSGLPPLIVLADFVVGRQLEDHPTVWQAMFHPDILRAEVERKLGVTPKLLYQRQGEAFPVTGSTGRLVMLAIGLVFALPLLAVRTRRWARVGVAVACACAVAYVVLEIMPVLGAVSAVVPVAAVGAFAFALHPRRGETAAVAWATLHLAFWGILVWTLVVVSSIEGVRWNEVALVAMPLDLALPFLSPAWRRGYARFRLAFVVVASLLCAIGVLRQPLWIPLLVVLMPLAVLALVRSRQQETSPATPAVPAESSSPTQ